MERARGILVLICCAISVIAAYSGTGSYCRDPDTGFLHPANSTWQSTTFCGNYSCKLRKRNPHQLPLRAINITYVNITQPSKIRSATNDNISKSDVISVPKDDKQTEQAFTFDSPELAMLKSLLPTGQMDLSKLNIQERLKHHQSNDQAENGDRFLTDEEIKTISELLHNVKKSDLEAIVDIYSLAQDIYKEMDKMTTENVLEETFRLANDFNDKPDKKVSYWYEPSFRLNKAEDKLDMEKQGSNIVTTTTTPTRSSPNPNTYFGGPLTKNDFGKLPYYYPMSSFQRQSSYIHPTYNPQPPMPTPKPPCNAHVNNVPQVPPYYPPPLPPSHYLPPLPPSHYQPPPPPPPYNYANPPQTFAGVLKRPFTVETQKHIQPSNLLPYPFSYVQHYNASAPINPYFENGPWARFDLNSNHNQKSFYKAHLSQIPSNAIPANNDNKDKKGDTEHKRSDSENILDNLITNAKSISKTKPDWQTDPIPEQILDEVRAHFEEKAKLLKPFSLRKKVKLERVGKVVKLDELHREKRSLESDLQETVSDDGDMETYIEKTTCLSDIDPGYFRMGNLTEPYPACCPQRITNTQ